MGVHLALVFASLLNVALTQNKCDSTFTNFLNCIADSTGDPQRGKQLEIEFDEDFVTLTGRCYDIVDNGANTKCILNREDLDTDVYGEDGPLRGCTICQKIAGTIRNKFFKTDESVRKCFRDKFSAAVVEELQPVIQKLLSDATFKIPQLPDFDKSTKDYMEIVERGMSHRIMAYSRLQVCRSRFPNRANATSECLNNPNGLYTQHCNLVKSCRSSVIETSCENRFTEVKAASCRSMQIKRNEWHLKLDQIREAVFNSETPADCTKGIKNAVGVWRQKLEDAMKVCLANVENDIPNIPLDKLIELGCLRAQSVKGSDDGKKQLSSGFRLVRNLLDALNDRITNFCETGC